MAFPPYGNGFQPRTRTRTSGYFPRGPRRRNDDMMAKYHYCKAVATRAVQELAAYLRSKNLGFVVNLVSRVAWHVQMNLSARRLLSFPHLLFALWVLLLLWGEDWVFSNSVERCNWDKWERWPSGSSPHRLILIADPQLIDPHTYPDRPWPLDDLTLLITDNYLRRAYTRLQSRLRPDSVFFLGDLFDGGREWKTATGDFADSKWSREHRPRLEKQYVKMWQKRYGEGFWLDEYARFGDIFFDNWKLGGDKPGPWQRGRKLVASLPGNHDLGFGNEIKLPVRDRFYAYFGEGNRVDVVGNHTVVSVDTVSLSAGSSDTLHPADFKPIFDPIDGFLRDVSHVKQRAVERELRFWRGETEELAFPHAVEDAETADVNHLPSLKGAADANAELPTILLTHVPLYREPGTPCGPLRERWPPAPQPPGQTDTVEPDHRNAIPIAKGYQYQNVLSEEDSVRLVKTVGNVVQVFSGDDHDYCEVTHSERKKNAPEITVKTLNMAMGVAHPGFVMVSLYNPVDGHGSPLPGAPARTLQTHLCVLPDQISTFMNYAIFVGLTIAAIAVRAILVPVLNLTPFSLAAAGQINNNITTTTTTTTNNNNNPMKAPPSSSLLPLYDKAKQEDDGTYDMQPTSASSGSSKYLASRFSDVSRTRSSSLTSNNGVPPPGRASLPGGGRSKHHHPHQGKKLGPRIDIYKDELYRYGDHKPRFPWRGVSTRSTKTSIRLVLTEVVACTWRVAWLSVLLWAYLTYKG
ncbi:cell division control protein [Sodiomyces alkalinus F11]|uniref:Cell division control protein n=1 Tax=Sodiomyces alkalinus (strain CBS 110278 / VKM F-3762 / F11) TaxID=1314773 RepID=A0A3N2PKP1_SODAK|nr:cell division control protein [Sodiomyces alkalinus F11]ROT34984.1 cell division control protein [Sodiomyces alkalinus F11]